MKKNLILIFISLLVCVIYSCKDFNITNVNISSKLFKEENTGLNNYDLFFPEISKKTTPNDLLVMVFLYDDYTDHNQKTDFVFNMTDQEIESKYHNEIFGSGNIEQQTWSVNDFYKENSKEKFYFNPILIDNNTTGIYPIRLNKVYDEKDFSSDIKQGFESLVLKGLITDGYNYEVNSKEKDTQQKRVLCIFPKIALAHVGTYHLSEKIYSEVAVTDFSSVLSTTTHELGHTIGLPDLYRQGVDQPTLMGMTTLKSTIPDLRYPGATNNHTLRSHTDPLHKIVLGWVDYEIIDKDSHITLYPTTSSLYNTVIVPTDDNNQYYIIENRKAVSFESQITDFAQRSDVDDYEDAGYSNYEGINVWRIDKLGYESLYFDLPARKGDFIISTLKYPMDSISPKKYSSILDKNDSSKENTNIKITYIKSNPDNSVDIDINFVDESTNSYIVRYNSNDGTNVYIDNTYKYTQNIIFPSTLFSREGFKFLGWSTKKDGSNIIYNTDDKVSGLSNEEGAVVNLYAQWEMNTYTVKFNLNGAQGTMPDSIVNLGLYVLPECYVQNSNPDLEFKGWLFDGLLFLPGSQIYIDKDTEIDAVWEEKTFNVTFNSNDETNNISKQSIKGATTKLNKNTFTKIGYIFKEWNTKKDGTGKRYIDNQEITINTNITLYAQWTPISYNIRFNSNDENNLIKEQTLTYDKNSTLAGNTFKRKGYTFEGWNTKKDGTGTSYNNKDVVLNLSNKQDDIINLYAQWKESPLTDNYIWKVINRETYCFDSSGKMQKGIIDVDGQKYLLGVSSGKLYTNGLATITYGEQEGTYYTNKEGIVQTGFIEIENDTYYFAKDGRMQKGIVEVEGQRYLLGVSSGKLYTNGLATITYGEQEGTYYTNKEGIVQTGFIEIENDTYYFAKDGRMQKGIVEVEGQRYLLGITTGKLYKNGLATITDGEQAGTYYTDKKGIVQTSWQTIEENTYYFDKDGKMQKGIIEVEGQRYLLGVSSGKLYKNGLATITYGAQEGTYCTDEKGTVQTSWQTIEENTYYFDKDGKMQKGIIEVEGQRYLLGITTGKLYTSGLAIITDGDQKGTYYTNKEGIIQTGVILINNKKYVFDQNGRLVD